MLTATGLMLLLAGEAPPSDPIWLRTLATILPFLGPIVVGLIAAPWLVQKVRGNGQSQNGNGAASVPTATALPTPVAREVSQADPLVKLLIEDLHGRLNQAHAELSLAHTTAMADGVQIARLSAELEDLEGRYQDALVSLADKSEEVRVTRGRLNEINRELEQTRRRLQICMEGYNP